MVVALGRDGKNQMLEEGFLWMLVTRHKDGLKQVSVRILRDVFLGNIEMPLEIKQSVAEQWGEPVHWKGSKRYAVP